jgi:hypothetical protein
MSINTLRGQNNPTPGGFLEDYVNIIGQWDPFVLGPNATSALLGTYEVYKIGNLATASTASLTGGIGDVDLQIFGGLETFINLIGTLDIRILIYADNTSIKADTTVITIDRV